MDQIIELVDVIAEGFADAVFDDTREVIAPLASRLKALEDRSLIPGPIGPHGERGADGINGKDGRNGVDGARGNRITAGTRPESGQPGDIHLDTATGDVYQWV